MTVSPSPDRLPSAPAVRSGRASARARPGRRVDHVRRRPGGRRQPRRLPPARVARRRTRARGPRPPRRAPRRAAKPRRLPRRLPDRRQARNRLQAARRPRGLHLLSLALQGRRLAVRPRRRRPPARHAGRPHCPPALRVPRGRPARPPVLHPAAPAAVRQPAHGRPSHGRPSHRQPSHGQPSHRRPSHRLPSHRQPPHGRPHRPPALARVRRRPQQGGLLPRQDPPRPRRHRLLHLRRALADGRLPARKVHGPRPAQLHPGRRRRRARVPRVRPGRRRGRRQHPYPPPLPAGPH